jgi:5-methylcytosine-specific restriction endonuclease McrA
MPSSPNYVRDIAQETRTAKARGDMKRNKLRKRLRRLAVKKGLVKPNDGKDIDHKVALKKGGSNTLANARVSSASDNRSFPRNPDGSMKKNV